MWKMSKAMYSAFADLPKTERDQGDKFDFRLTFHATLKHEIPIRAKFIQLYIGGAEVAYLFARNKETLYDDTHFHIEGYYFDTYESALKVGNSTRDALRLLNFLGGHSFVFSYEDTGPPPFSTIMDPSVDEKDSFPASVSGLFVFRRSDIFLFDQVGDFNLEVTSNDYTYIPRNLEKLLKQPSVFPQNYEDSVRLLESAYREQTKRTRFFLVYLAFENLLKRTNVDPEEVRLINQCQELVSNSGLSSERKTALKNRLSDLKIESVKNAVSKLFKSLKFETIEAGDLVRETVEKARIIRNKLAHEKAQSTPPDISIISDRLATFTRSLIFQLSKIEMPDLSPRNYDVTGIGGALDIFCVSPESKEIAHKMHLEFYSLGPQRASTKDPQNIV
jgi:hypothetical protein